MASHDSVGWSVIPLNQICTRLWTTYRYPCVILYRCLTQEAEVKHDLTGVQVRNDGIVQDTPIVPSIAQSLIVVQSAVVVPSSLMDDTTVDIILELLQVSWMQ